MTAVDGGGRTDDVLHTDASAVGPWETFEVTSVDGGKVSIKTVNKFYLCAVYGGGLSDVKPGRDYSPSQLEIIRVRLEQILSGLAQGNEGSAHVSLSQPDRLSLRFEATIRHYHKIRGITIYDWTMPAISGTLDLLNPASIGDVKVCCGRPGGGDVCVKLGDLVALLASL